MHLASWLPPVPPTRPCAERSLVVGRRYLLNLVTKPPPALRCRSAYAFPLWGGLLKDAYSLTQGQLQAIASTANVAGSVCVRPRGLGEGWREGRAPTLPPSVAPTVWLTGAEHAAVQPTTSPMLQLSPSPAALQGHRGGAGI